jgi:hypothetical protein
VTASTADRLGRIETLGANVARVAANDVDASARFPVETISAL